MKKEYRRTLIFLSGILGTFGHYYILISNFSKIKKGKRKKRKEEKIYRKFEIRNKNRPNSQLPERYQAVGPNPGNFFPSKSRNINYHTYGVTSTVTTIYGVTSTVTTLYGVTSTVTTLYGVN